MKTIHTIGILGGGQLGMMLAQAALKLGLRCVFLEDAPNAPASLYGQVYTTSELDDFIKASDVFTLEFENTPVATAERLANLDDKGGMFPPAKALSVAQDRLAEKALFNELGVTTVPYQAVNTLDELHNACDTLGLPLVLKTSRGGYDGKGQFVIKTTDDIAQAWAELGGAITGGAMPAPLIAEGFINFSREVSIIAVRSQSGNIRYYPLVENHHQNGILAKTIAPAQGVENLNQSAQESIAKILENLNYVGVLTLELFVTDNGLIANEIAPRVHNSGHWSIEGANCSQFENHIRAVAGLPLGDTSIVKPSVMLNIIGKYPDENQLLSIGGAHYHHYHKSERDGRKIGHITVMADDLATAVASAQQTLNNC
ncbi:5-(carboxyamino)imidazole ribonucleotide synthase [Moraxella caviae]|uniref:N5-carboxyaminoimidazole ribonucleotide synthase n=1 Tax=Moraxella caviae TaxID=34060 RepID=A0A1T0A9R2_9GAMM|nr:5-(carboxyamino)imidazole ribonucleotide synthase [Moraxella caviae]OOR92472.1 5-(carboxyamino)imidazole ribonucleotide synthase [Moraxella caviae]STZ13738.1 N5-carboxyaminoimidazole ribonucleotide synthase [Moraxella caviae]STZ13822.1 N5-carboxyaminoimidazole ribonucleotide synthase [Moraxella caviae]VEW10609.1 N5-carboxyaminoimidazole ribonucleotide synthase [Moraxella caviae]